MKATANQLSVFAARILAVTPRAPRTQVDSVLAEIAILIGDLCETADQADELTKHLVEHPQPRWNFQALTAQARQFTAPKPPPAPVAPLSWYGFDCPEWVWKPADGRYNQLTAYTETIEREIWRRIESSTPQRRRQLEDRVRLDLAEYQRGNPDGPFKNPTAEQIRHYMIGTAGRENAEARKKAGSLEPCPIPEPWPADTAPKTWNHPYPCPTFKGKENFCSRCGYAHKKVRPKT